MKKFLSIQWNNFKKYWYWYLIWVLLTYIYMQLLIIGFDFLLYELVDSSLFLSIEFISSLPIESFGLSGVFFMFISRYLNNFQLYVFSYYIYTGKNNWYKFFNEREKQQKLQNKLDWIEYKKNN